jgi:hypothetical protein
MFRKTIIKPITHFIMILLQLANSNTFKKYYSIKMENLIKELDIRGELYIKDNSLNQKNKTRVNS